jgi:hypothetical protein
LALRTAQVPASATSALYGVGGDNIWQGISDEIDRNGTKIEIKQRNKKEKKTHQEAPTYSLGSTPTTESSTRWLLVPGRSRVRFRSHGPAAHAGPTRSGAGEPSSLLWIFEKKQLKKFKQINIQL